MVEEMLYSNAERRNFNQEPEDEDSDDGYLQKEEKELTNNKMICRTNDITNENDKRYLARYNDDGINKTATYYSSLDKPNIRGKAKLMFQKTKHSQRYHFEANTTYTNGYQPENRKYIKAKRTQDEREYLPEITVGALSVEEFDEENEYKAENNNSIRKSLRVVATKKKDCRRKIIVSKAKNSKEQIDKTHLSSIERSIPEGNTNAKAKAVGNSSILREALQRTSEKDV